LRDRRIDLGLPFRRPVLRRLIPVVILLGLLAPAAATAGVKATPVATLSAPTYITAPPGDTHRVFVVQQSGQIMLIKDGAAPTTFMDISSEVKFVGGEQGLLSMAFAPDYATSHRFYVYYTSACPNVGCDEHVSEFTANANGDSAAPSSEHVLLTLPHPNQSNHNGGQLQFGPDDDLYISVGDGGGGDDTEQNAQHTDRLLGKILRIAPGATSYSIPAGNPFAGSPLCVNGTNGGANCPEVWAYGLRNPWRFSFDSATGDMVIGDVGQSLHEEVDFAGRPVAGFGGREADYGWSCREGLFAYTDATPTMNCPTGGFTDPVFEYPHTDPDPPADRAYGCSITGGYVVRDPSLTDLYGRYVYADYCTSEVRSLLLPELGDDTAGDDRTAGIATPTSNPVSFGEDSCHRLYIASGSEVLHFEGAAPATCPPPEKEDDEEPRFPPLIPVAPVTQTPNPFTPSPPPLSPAPTVNLEADDFGDGDFRMRVQVSACEPSDTDSIQLNRGGRRLVSKSANKGCATRFHVHLERPATFRAIFRSGPDASPVRSKRLSL
jgi:hypothetical protein